MATGKIMKRTVDAFHSADRDQFLWDDELRGFGVKATPAGNKVFLIQYRMGGRGTKTRRYTIGTLGSPWTPQAAREEAERLLRLVRQGTDPADDKAERERLATDLAFSPYAERFITGCLKVEWVRSYPMAERILRNHVMPVLKSKPLPSIRKADVRDVLDRLPSDQAGLRRNAFSVLRRLFRWAVENDHLEASPLASMDAPPAPGSGSACSRIGSCGSSG